MVLNTKRNRPQSVFDHKKRLIKMKKNLFELILFLSFTMLRLEQLLKLMQADSMFGTAKSCLYKFYLLYILSGLLVS